MNGDPPQRTDTGPCTNAGLRTDTDTGSRTDTGLRTDTDDRAAAVSVTVYPDGPLVLRGDFEVRHVDGSAVPTGRLVALCRCGRSARKPLCDGSHKAGTAGRTAGAQGAGD